MSNETTPQLVECRIKSFETNGNEWTTVTLQIPEHITDAVVKASTSREPMLRVLVEAVPAVPAQGVSASNETTTIKVTATPEWLAEQAVTRVSSAGIVLKRADGRTVVHFGRQHVHAPEGEQLAAVRAWLVEQIRGAYKAGVESVAQAKADGAAALVETYGPDALAKAREEGRADAFRKVAEWCQTSVPDTIDFDASIVEEVAKDAIGRLQNDAYNGDSRARKEGRQQGQAEIIAYFDSTAEQHVNARDRGQREAHSLRAQAARLDEEARVHQATADMARGVAAELRSITSKEPA